MPLARRLPVRLPDDRWGREPGPANVRKDRLSGLLPLRARTGRRSRRDDTGWTARSQRTRLRCRQRAGGRPTAEAGVLLRRQLDFRAGSGPPPSRRSAIRAQRGILFGAGRRRTAGLAGASIGRGPQPAPGLRGHVDGRALRHRPGRPAARAAPGSGPDRSQRGLRGQIRRRQAIRSTDGKIAGAGASHHAVDPLADLPQHPASDRQHLQRIPELRRLALSAPGMRCLRHPGAARLRGPLWRGQGRPDHGRGSLLAHRHRRHHRQRRPPRLSLRAPRAELNHGHAGTVGRGRAVSGRPG